MRRLDRLLTHITLDGKDSAEVKSLKQHMSLHAIRSEFHVSDDRLKEMMLYMVHEMERGLARPNGSTLQMLPSFVKRRNVSQISGVHYALDLGGTNFRVHRMLLREGMLVSRLVSPAVKIPMEHVKGTAEGLFGFIAEQVAEFIKKGNFGDENEKGSSLPLGFTFSFPMKLETLNSGKLLYWTKDFTTSGVVGEDVAKLLQRAFETKGVNMRVAALCNDTVGTLITCYFKDAETKIGLILGTGANACYWERCDRILKDPASAAAGKEEMVINMEFGNFDSEGCYVLPITHYDEEIDKASAQPGKQRFEKLISGKYLGEIDRMLILSLARNGSLPKSLLHALARYECFTPQDASNIITDKLPGLHGVKKLFAERFGVKIEDDSDCQTIREICILVRHRAAQCAAMAIAAILLKTGSQYKATVAVDGSVYELSPGFQHVMRETIKALLGPTADVKLVLTGGGSGIGAGYIAALAQLLK